MTLNDAFSIERELAPGERLLWKGRPQTGIKFRWRDRYAIPFFIVWAGGACFVEYLALTGKFAGGPETNSLAAVIFIPFVVIGIYQLVGRFFIDAYLRKGIEYALTDRRAIIMGGVFSRRARSIDYKADASVTLEELSDASGTIYFGEKAQGEESERPKSRSLLAFDMIDNARDIYNRILKAKATEAR